MDGMNSARVRACRARFAAGEPVVAQSAAVSAWLRSSNFNPRPVIKTDGRALTLDLSAASGSLGPNLQQLDVHGLSRLIDRAMRAQGTEYAFGRWGEHRALYNSEHFSAGGTESRTVHMGIDLFCPALTAVYAPLDGRVEIVANNARELDYGPLLVLRHRAPGGAGFFTLYGHLDLAGVQALAPGQQVTAGEHIADIGSPPGNGNWPPHLHFQVILDLLDLGADFPGVAYRSQQAFWLAMSPHPAPFFPEADAVMLDGRPGAAV